MVEKYCVMLIQHQRYTPCVFVLLRCCWCSLCCACSHVCRYCCAAYIACKIYKMRAYYSHICLLRSENKWMPIDCNRIIINFWNWNKQNTMLLMIEMECEQNEIKWFVSVWKAHSKKAVQRRNRAKFFFCIFVAV